MNRSLLFLLIAYVLLVFAVSLVRFADAPGPEFQMKDKLVHTAEFITLGLLLFGAFRWSIGPSKLATFVFLLTLGMTVGAIDEMIQSQIPGRNMDIFDWIADSLGTAVGVGVCVFTPLGRRTRARGGNVA
jgi:VanZ family protein